MIDDSPNYEAICDKELAAADRAHSSQARVAHLERALHNALLAAKGRPARRPVDLMRWRDVKDARAKRAQPD